MAILIFTEDNSIGHRGGLPGGFGLRFLFPGLIMVAEKVVHEAEVRLDRSSHLFLRHVACHFEDGALCIEGKVPSFYLKQTAQSLLQSLEGVERVVNRLEVVNSYGVSSDLDES